MRNKKGLPVYMYDMEGKLLKKFEQTKDCAEFFDKDPDYICHNMQYCDKIKKDNTWYRITREPVDML